MSFSSVGNVMQNEWLSSSHPARPCVPVMQEFVGLEEAIAASLADGGRGAGPPPASKARASPVMSS